MLKQGDLELKKRILPWVHVHGMNASGIIEEVVERIAPGAGDHDHAAARHPARASRGRAEGSSQQVL
jgi:hypothetical protein